jgi:hypothetical protein
MKSRSIKDGMSLSNATETFYPRAPNALDHRAFYEVYTAAKTPGASSSEELNVRP